MPNVNKAIVMATLEFWTDKATDERKQVTDWHRIATSNQLADIAS